MRTLAARFFASFPFILCVLCADAQAQAWLDPELDPEARAAALVSQLTLEEKVAQMADVAPAIERLGVPEYNWWNEALHGVARSGLATVFPQAIGMAAMWNDSLMLRLATVISDEARAKHHEYVRAGKRLRYQGLTIWSPNINLFRDPRWGRGQETYGEDPFLTGQLAVQFIRGLQGNDPRHFKTIATVKHYAVHSGPEPERHAFDAVVSERDLRESYLPHFERSLREGGAYSVMCAYNRVYGDAACGSDLLLKDLLRGEYGFRGYVVSDCGAIDDIFRHHKIVPTGPAAAALAVRSGTDLDCGRVYNSSLVAAVRQGLITEAEIDVAVRRLFTARFRLGMFDPAERVPFAQIPYRLLDQPEHRALARRVAQESMVLLKNQGGVLPLRKDLRALAVIGPNADQWMTLLGNYNGMPADPVTPLRGIREAVSPRTRVAYARGAEIADSFPTFDVVPAGVLFHGDRDRGLQVEYFSSMELTGTPAHTATDSVVDANWRDRAPRAGMNNDDFGVRWSGTVRPDRTGVYQLGLIGTMKFELYLNDSLVVQSTYGYRNEFGDPRLRTARPVTLEAGKSYRIRVDAHESYGDAQLQMVWTEPPRDLLGDAVKAASDADAVVLVLGLTPRLEGEEMDVRIPGFRGGDRTTLDLPASQQRLLERITATGKPTVLVLLNGSALAVNWAHAHVPAILEAWYPGQAGGTAIADVLFGDYNPAGRLPVTFYRSVDDLPAFEDYAMRGRTYRYFAGEPLYAFGHGLSYTTFGYADLVASADTMSPSGSVTVSAAVSNTGARAGAEVVQLYVQHLEPPVERPLKELKGYRRITLQPGETRTVSFVLPAAQLARWDTIAHRWRVDSGRFRVMVGPSSADLRLNDTITVGANPSGAAPARPAGWVATWAPSQQLTEPRNMPPAPGLRGSTVRQAFRVSIGGTRIRLRFSNVFGDAPLTLASARLARPTGLGAIDPATNRALTFNGDSSVTIAAGASVTSDDLRYDVAPLSDLAVSMHVTAVADRVTGHPGSRATSFLQSGPHTAAAVVPDAVPVEHWYLLSAVDVWADDAAAAVAALGNSITDGRGSGTDKNNRWTDNLARRLHAAGTTARIAVINAGLGGNTVIRGGLGPPALERLDRDVLDQPGVRWVIVFEGVNDIGTSRGPGATTIAQELISAYGQIIARARARGLHVYGATILPIGGSAYDTPEHEAARQAVNEWIRTSGAYDAVIDLDAALRDPANPARLLDAADSGDHLHLSEHGYQLLADAIDLSLFAEAQRRAR